MYQDERQMLKIVTLGIESARRLLELIQTLIKAEQEIVADVSEKERENFWSFAARI